MGKTIQQVIGGLGEKKSNNGTQYFQQDRVYNLADISCCIPSQLPGGGTNLLEIVYLGKANGKQKDT
ncbi:MAG: hypothetical protein MJ197_10525 [Bacteroidales bacterium]|nr:hypothetical protein [Bacteroidales bacterium]